MKHFAQIDGLFVADVEVQRFADRGDAGFPRTRARVVVTFKNPALLEMPAGVVADTAAECLHAWAEANGVVRVKQGGPTRKATWWDRLKRLPAAELSALVYVAFLLLIALATAFAAAWGR